MKRKIAMLLSILLILTLCSCAAEETDAPAETENTIVEISRGDSGEDTNKLAASAVAYTDSFQSADGSVNVEINLEDTSLYEGSFRTLQITPRPFTGEEVRHIANVLFGDAVFYEYIFCREYTKAELEEQRAFWQALLEREDLDELHCVLGTDGELRKTIETSLEKHKVEAAPEEIERTICDFSLKPYAYYYEDQEENVMRVEAFSEIGGVPYRFRAENNTHGVRAFSISAWIGYDTVSPLGIREEVLKDKLLCVEKPDQNQIDAIREKAEKIIAELGMGQWQIDQCQCKEKTGLEWGTRYSIKITAVPVYNGIPLLRQEQPYTLRGTEEGIQNCNYPDLALSFAPDGTLLTFSLNTPVDILAVSGEESRMMSFSELMGSVKTQFSLPSADEYFMSYYAWDHSTAEVLIDKIVLGYDMLALNNVPGETVEYCGTELTVNNSDFVLVPAVAIYGNYRLYETSPEEENAFDYREDTGEDALFTILNASNGSMIAPKNSMQILPVVG